MTRAVNELPLKLNARHTNKFRRGGEIVFAQVDEPLLVATIDAAALAGELQIQP